MRPKQLQPVLRKIEPFTQDGVLYLPCAFDGKMETDISFLKQPENKLCVEYCSGNGHWIAERAIKDPTISWIAVEKNFTRVRKIWSKKHNQHIDNLSMICGQAEDANRLFDSSSVSEIYIHFPDPWTKRKHEKFRLFTQEFFVDVARALQPLGKLIIVTDNLPYGKSAWQIIQEIPNLHSVQKAPHYLSIKSYGSSTFEELWTSKGREFYLFEFEKCS